jgi:hypothetical protein
LRPASPIDTATFTLINGALKIMAWTKTKTGVVAAVVLILAAATTTEMARNSGHSCAVSFI